jgi:hypothetical protein
MFYSLILAKVVTELKTYFEPNVEPYLHPASFDF